MMLLSTWWFLFAVGVSPMNSQDLVVWSLWYLFGNTESTSSMPEKGSNSNSYEKKKH